MRAWYAWISPDLNLGCAVLPIEVEGLFIMQIYHVPYLPNDHIAVMWHTIIVILPRIALSLSQEL